MAIINEVDLPKYIAEFAGTYILVLTIGFNVLGGLTIWTVVSIAMSLMVGIYALGSISGAHFNPAVTFSVALSNKMLGGWQQAGCYMVVQLSGALAASFTYFAVFKENIPLQPGKGFTPVQACLAELLYTFMLCFVVLNVACATSTKDNQYFGMAIGNVIVAGGYAVGTISGGIFNPAVAFGLDVSSWDKGFKWSVIYTVFELIGAALASVAFKQVRAEDFGGYKNTLTSRVIAEFIGTFFLVMTAGFNILAGNIAAPYSIGACLMVMVYALGNVSGAHFNPAVTLAVYLSGRNKIPQRDAWFYLASQLLGGILGGATYATILQRVSPVVPKGASTWAQVGLAEILFTAQLCFVVLSCVTVRETTWRNNFFGLAIGGAVVAGGFAAGNVSGGYLNPAVSIGLDTANGLRGGYWGYGLVYSFFELLGATVATALFLGMRPEEYAPKSNPKSAVQA